MPWGQGETPLKEILQVMKRRKFKFPRWCRQADTGACGPQGQAQPWTPPLGFGTGDAVASQVSAAEIADIRVTGEFGFSSLGLGDRDAIFHVEGRSGRFLVRRGRPPPELRGLRKPGVIDGSLWTLLAHTRSGSVIRPTKPGKPAAATEHIEVYRPHTNTWEVFAAAGSRPGVKIVGNWLLMIAREVARAGRAPEIIGVWLALEGEPLGGRPVSGFLFDTSDLYCPGVLFAMDLDTGTTLRLDTNQGDSEPLIVQDGFPVLPHHRPDPARADKGQRARNPGTARQGRRTPRRPLGVLRPVKPKPDQVQPGNHQARSYETEILGLWNQWLTGGSRIYFPPQGLLLGYFSAVFSSTFLATFDSAPGARAAQVSYPLVGASALPWGIHEQIEKSQPCLLQDQCPTAISPERHARFAQFADGSFRARSVLPIRTAATVPTESGCG